MLNPRCLSRMSSYDVASNICRALGGGSSAADESVSSAAAGGGGRGGRGVKTRDERTTLLDMLTSNVIFSQTTAEQREALVEQMFQAGYYPRSLLCST